MSCEKTKTGKSPSYLLSEELQTLLGTAVEDDVCLVSQASGGKPNAHLTECRHVNRSSHVDKQTVCKETPTALAESKNCCAIDRNGEEYQNVERKFFESMVRAKFDGKIDCIYAVENQKLKDQHMRMEAEIPDDILLFHGTPDIDPALCIAEQGFDPGACRKNGKNAIYGKGIYFARNASYAHHYTEASSNGRRFMFMARVRVGKSSIGSEGLEEPPPGCNSLVDKETNPQVYAVANTNQAYPAYLIEYTGEIKKKTKLPSTSPLYNIAAISLSPASCIHYTSSTTIVSHSQNINPSHMSPTHTTQ